MLLHTLYRELVEEEGISSTPPHIWCTLLIYSYIIIETHLHNKIILSGKFGGELNLIGSLAVYLCDCQNLNPPIIYNSHQSFWLYGNEIHADNRGGV